MVTVYAPDPKPYYRDGKQVFAPEAQPVAAVTPEYLAKALARREIVRKDGVYTLRPDAEARLLPKTELTAEQKRRLHLAKQRKS